MRRFAIPPPDRRGKAHRVPVHAGRAGMGTEKTFFRASFMVYWVGTGKEGTLYGEYLA